MTSNEHKFNLQDEKIQRALDTLAFGSLIKMEVYQNTEVILRYPQGNVWLAESCVTFSTPVKGMQIHLNTEELNAISYLHENRALKDFISIVQNWIESKEKTKQKNQFGIISKSLQQDMKEINEILKRWEKLLNNLPI